MATEELRSAIERLALIDRSPCSKGEHEAAEWIASALRQLGAEAEVERERIHGSYWWPLGITSGLGILGGWAALRGRRLLGAVLAGAATAEVFDELGAGRRVLRRLLPKQVTANVVAYAGDRDATRTLVVLAHHDAANTSVFFDPRITEYVGSRAKGHPDRPPEHPPMMAPIAIAPGLVAVGSLLGLRPVIRFGSLVCAGVIGSFLEIAHRMTVPGANDNLTAVAAVLGLARALREQPVQGLRMVLVSTGSEETLMEGMRAFAARHFPAMDPEQTRVLCLDAIGSPHLILAESEGMLRLRRYDGQFKDLVAECAAATGVAAQRGVQIRLGTDGIVALRWGFPAAMLTSFDDHGVPSNYHLPTDTPDRVDYPRLEDAVRLCEAVMRRLAEEPVPGAGGGNTAASAEQPAPLVQNPPGL